MNIITYYDPAVKGEVITTNLTDETAFDIFQRLTNMDSKNMAAFKELYYSCGCRVAYQDAVYGNIQIRDIDLD